MKFNVHYSVSLIPQKKHLTFDIFSDLWKYATIEADTEEKAIELLKGICIQKKYKLNYVLSITPI